MFHDDGVAGRGLARFVMGAFYHPRPTPRKQIIVNSKDYLHNPENLFTLTILGAFAEFERAEIMERSTRARLRRLPMAR